MTKRSRLPRFIFSAAALLASLPVTSHGQTVPPRIFYSDLDSGPNTGGENNLGAYVSIYGTGFGSAPGTVTAGGGAVANYKIWSNTKVVFQLGPAAATGNIVLANSNGVSNGMPFTVRPGNIYFVATNGSDSAAGTVSAPWKTLLHARDTVAAGDVVYARNGVAQITDDGQGWSACITLGGVGGVAGKPIAMVVYPGETATIGDPSSCPSGIRTKGEGESYWTFAGFNLRGRDEALTTSIGVTNGIPPQYWRVVANDMTCPNGDGASACYETGQSGYLKVYGNNVHDTGTANASALYQGVYFSTDTNHVDFGWNTIANVHGCRGLQIHSSPLQGGGPNDPTGYNQYDLLIHDNVIHDTQCDGMVIYTVDPSKGPVQIYNNVIYNAGKGPNNPEGSGAWSCIYAGAFTNDGPAGSGTIEIYNNTLYNCGSFANPPYGSSSAGVLFGGPDAQKSVRLRNNIIDQSPDPSIPYFLADNPNGSNCSPCSRVSGSNNLVFGGTGTLDSSFTATVNANPLLVNPAGANFHLLSGSPAATAGISTGLATDFDGVPVPQGSAYPIGAYALFTGSTTTGVSVQVSPGSAALQGGQSQAFTASVTGSSNTAVTWSLSPATGSVTQAGVYTAPPVIGSAATVTVTATSAADATRSASASVTLTPVAISISAGGSLTAGQTKQFIATVSGSSNAAVTWSINPVQGSISTAGLYTAPSTIAATSTVTVTATSAADPSKSASATVTLNPTAAVSVAVSPSTASLQAGQTAQFKATVTGSTNTSVTWSLSPASGTIGTSGLYTAPASIAAQQTVTVTAKSVADTTKAASAVVTLNPTATGGVSITISPTTATLGQSQTAQFTATVSGSSNTAVNWSASPAGTISASGLYTAPASIAATQIVTVTAISSADSTKSASALVTLTPSAIVVSPNAATVPAGGQTQFTASIPAAASKTKLSSTAGVTWSVSPQIGSISSTGLYKAPAAVSSTSKITVSAISGALTGTATVTLVPAGKYSVTVTSLGGQNVRVSWTAPAGRPKGDWIGLSSYGTQNWWTLWGKDTGGTTSGSIDTTAPNSPGLWEFRYYANATFNVLAASDSIPVLTAGYAVSAAPLAVKAGAPLQLNWSVPSAGDDCVFLVQSGKSNDLYTWYVNVTKNTGSPIITAPLTKGTYEVRYATQSCYVTVARSAPVTVQ